MAFVTHMPRTHCVRLIYPTNRTVEVETNLPSRSQQPQTLPWEITSMFARCQESVTASLMSRGASNAKSPLRNVTAAQTITGTSAENVGDVVE